MKVNGLVLQGAVICSLLFLVCSQEAKQRRRRCHCKKYIEKINRDVNKRLKDFENKFDKYISQNNHGYISNDLKSKLNKTMAMNNKLDNLNAEMNETKEALRRESYNLRVVQENLYSQDVTLDNLNTNFKKLEEIVKSLSVVVEHLEETMRTSSVAPEALTSNTMSDSGIFTLPTKTYPKGKF